MDLCDIQQIKALLSRHGFHFSKSMGQNFLVEDWVPRDIAEASGASPSCGVLEVGPGIGTLTMALLQHAGRVVSVERDPDLPAVLAETLAPWADRFALVQKDALDLTVDDLRDALGRLDPPETAPGKLVANLPYAVAATVVLDYFERFPSLGSATVMVQKEVADRMAAVPGTKNYGAYTVKLRLYAEPAGRFGVGPGNFFPPPRVESAVLRLDRRPLHGEDGAPLAASTLKAAATMADAAFANRRKTLSNSCKTYFASRGVQGARIAAALPQLLEQAAVDPKIRGEALALEDFIRLGTALEALGA